MKYIDINQFIANLPQAVVTSLANKHQAVVNSDDQGKKTVIGGGNPTWIQTKGFLEAASNRKCWYTESKNPGCPSDVEHFRPKGEKKNADGELQHWYWFLAFEPKKLQAELSVS